MKNKISSFLMSMLIAFGLSGCSDNSQVADNFFDTIQNNELEEAYSITSNEFQSSTDLEGFQYTIRSYNLTADYEIEWQEAVTDESAGVGRLIGILTFEENKTDELVIDLGLILEEDEWKILSIKFQERKNTKELFKDINLPDGDKIIDMADETIKLFFNDINNNNLNNSYKATANLWQEQVTFEKFTESFKAFLDLEEKDFSIINDNEPIFTVAPAMSKVEDKTVLTVQGQYLSNEEPYALFVLQYILEDENWKLTGMNVGLK